EFECVGTRPSKAYSRCYTAVASACRVIRYETTVRTRKCEDRTSRALESLAQHSRIDIKRFGGFGPWKVENLTKDVGEPVRPVKALEHRQRAADLDFLNEHRPLVLAGAIGSESFRQVFGQAHEIQFHALDGAPLPV